mgnify:CR=1 FL=1
MKLGAEEAVAVHSSKVQLRRWAGTVEDLQGAIEACALAIRNWTGEAPSVTVEVRMPELESIFSSAEALEALDPRDLAVVRSVRIEVGSLESAGVVIDMDGSAERRALEARVTGPSFPKARGLAIEIQDRLRPHELTGPQWIGRFTWIGPLLVVSVAAYLLIDNPWLYVADDWVRDALSSRARWAIFGGCAVMALLAALASYFAPSLQLLRDGEHPKWVRLRTQLFAATIAVVVGVASAILADPFTD